MVFEQLRDRGCSISVYTWRYNNILVSTTTSHTHYNILCPKIYRVFSTRANEQQILQLHTHSLLGVIYIVCSV